MKFPKTKNLVLLLNNLPSFLKGFKRSKSFKRTNSYELGRGSGKNTINVLDSDISFNAYGVLRIHVGFTNVNLTLTTLTGQVLRWANGGELRGSFKETKRTRMTGRAIKNLILYFLNSKRGAERLIQQIRYLKVLFTGPSKRFRGKFLSLIQKKYRRSKVRLLCKEEGFRRSFNGCRLARKKR